MRRLAWLLLGLGLLGCRPGPPQRPPTPADAAPTLKEEQGPRGRNPPRVFCWGATFSPDGKLLFLEMGWDPLHRPKPGDFRPLELWDVQAGKRLRAFPEPGWGSLCFLPDSKHILAGGLHQPLCVREAATGKVVRTFEGSPRPTGPAAVSPDGRLAVFSRRAGEDVALEVWDVQSGKRLRRLAQRDFWWIRFSPDGRHVYAASVEGEEVAGLTAGVWSVRSGRLLHQVGQGQRWLHPQAFSPSGRWAVSGRPEGRHRSRLVLWEVATRKAALTFEGSGPGGPVAFTADGRHVLAVVQGEILRRWDTATGRRVSAVRLDEEGVSASAFSADGRLLFTACGSDEAPPGWEQMRLELWDTATGKRLRELKRPEAG